MIESKALLSALIASLAIIERRNTIPVLSMVRLEGTGDRLKVTATDLDIWVEQDLDAPGIGDWATCAPAQAMRDFLKTVDAAAEVTFTLPDDDPRMVLTAGRASIRLAILPADDFPLPFFAERDQGDAQVAVEAADIGAIMKAAAPYIAKDRRFGSSALNGVNVTVTAEGVAIAATSGSRLFNQTLKSGAIKGEHAGAIMPRKAAEWLAKFSPKEGDAWLELAEHWACVDFARTRLITKLIDAVFPVYVAPERATVAQLDATGLKAAIELVLTVAGYDKLKPFRMQMVAGEVILSAGIDAYGTGETVLDAHLVDMAADAAIVMDLNGVDVLAALKTFRKGETIAMEYAGDEAAFLLRSVERPDVEATVAPRRKPQVETPLERPIVEFEAPEAMGGQNLYKSRTFYMASEKARNGGYGGWTYHEFPSAAAANRAYRRHVAAARARCDVTAEPLALTIWAGATVPRSPFTVEIPASGYMPLPNWYLAEAGRRLQRRTASDFVFSTTGEGEATWTREVLDRADVIELLVSPAQTVSRGRTKALRAVGERWLKRAPVAEPVAQVAVITIPDVIEVEPVPAGYTELTREQLVAMAERTERIEQARDAFAATNDNDVTWTRKVLGLKLADAVEATPMLTVLKGRTGPIRALGATALKRAA